MILRVTNKATKAMTPGGLRNIAAGVILEGYGSEKEPVFIAMKVGGVPRAGWEFPNADVSPLPEPEPQPQPVSEWPDYLMAHKGEESKRYNPE